MTDESHNQQDEWPKEVLVKQTVEAATADLGPDFDPDSDENDTVLNEIGESMHTIEIDSWADIPLGYEPVLDDEAHIASYEAYINSKERP